MTDMSDNLTAETQGDEIVQQSGLAQEQKVAFDEQQIERSDVDQAPPSSNEEVSKEEV